MPRSHVPSRQGSRLPTVPRNDIRTSHKRMCRILQLALSPAVLSSTNLVNSRSGLPRQAPPLENSHRRDSRRGREVFLSRRGAHRATLRWRHRQVLSY